MNPCGVRHGLSGDMLVVGPVLKIKTGFRGFETEKIRDFENLHRFDKKFYTSIHELYYQ